jgi:hypothetical protein
MTTPEPSPGIAPDETTGNPDPVPPIIGEGGELYGDAATTPDEAPDRPDDMPAPKHEDTHTRTTKK